MNKLEPDECLQKKGHTREINWDSNRENIGLEAIFLSFPISKGCRRNMVGFDRSMRRVISKWQSARSIQPLRRHPLFEMTLLVKDFKPRFVAAKRSLPVQWQAEIE
jgi:hypothetical protein